MDKLRDEQPKRRINILCCAFLLATQNKNCFLGYGISKVLSTMAGINVLRKSLRQAEFYQLITSEDRCFSYEGKYGAQYTVQISSFKTEITFQLYNKKMTTALLYSSVKSSIPICNVIDAKEIYMLQLMLCSCFVINPRL